jgi:hypothetical protein
MRYSRLLAIAAIIITAALTPALAEELPIEPDPALTLAASRPPIPKTCAGLLMASHTTNAIGKLPRR